MELLNLSRRTPDARCPFRIQCGPPNQTCIQASWVLNDRCKDLLRVQAGYHRIRCNHHSYRLILHVSPLCRICSRYLALSKSLQEEKTGNVRAAHVKRKTQSSFPIRPYYIAPSLHKSFRHAIRYMPAGQAQPVKRPVPHKPTQAVSPRSHDPFAGRQLTAP